MKKISIIVTIALLSVCSVFANESIENEYYQESIQSFINSPSKEDLPSITDADDLYCETIYLEANRRREYTPTELSKCEIYIDLKNQDEINYKNFQQIKREID